MKGTEPGARSFEHLMGVKVRPAHMERSYEASVEDLMASKLRLDTRLVSDTKRDSVMWG